MPPSSDYVSLRKGVSELIAETGAFLVEATRGQTEEADTDEAETGRQLIDEQLQRFWRSYGLLRGHNNETLTVAILALTKSGKSSLLNALLSAECLPMNNVPETARICKIVHSATEGMAANAEPWLQEPGVATPVRGERAIRARLTELNSAVRAHSYAETGDEQLLHIHASIAALREYDGAGLPAVALLDTPGPNEAGEEGLRFQVDRLLDSVDAVVYLLDYTKLKTAEEESIFRRLKQINPQLVKRLSQRLFFVVNKADGMHVTEGMNADDTRSYVAQLVTQQLSGEGFQLQPEQVLLVSARDALLARLVLSGKATDEVAKRFIRVAFGASRSVPTQDQIVAVARSMLEESGVPDLESQVLTFLYAHSAGVKLIATLDNVSRLLSEMSNVAVSCRACLRTNVDQLQVQSEGLRSNLMSTLAQFDDVLTSTDALQSEVTDEIRAHLQSLRVRLFNHILQTLEADGPAVSAASTSAPPASRLKRPWQILRDKFLSMFTSTSTTGETPAVKSRSREELQKLLLDLHEGLMKQIHVEVGEFWLVLEGCTNARHAALVRQLNTSLSTLSKQVEDAVCTGLQVSLTPVDISMPTPSAAEFHSDLNDLISKGIISTQEKHLRVNQRQYEERVLKWRQGVCQWGAYWETVPRTRTVVETYDVTMYELRPNEISAHFIALVDSAIETTSQALSGYVRSFVRQQLQAARDKIEEYSERYLSAMTSALETSHRGVEARAVALADVERHMTVLADLSAKTAALQAKADLMVPQLQDAVPYDELSDEEFQEMMGGVVTAVPPTVPPSDNTDNTAPAAPTTAPAAAAAAPAEANLPVGDEGSVVDSLVAQAMRAAGILEAPPPSAVDSSDAGTAMHPNEYESPMSSCSSTCEEMPLLRDSTSSGISEVLEDPWSEEEEEEEGDDGHDEEHDDDEEDDEEEEEEEEEDREQSEDDVDEEEHEEDVEELEDEEGEEDEGDEEDEDAESFEYGVHAKAGSVRLQTGSTTGVAASPIATRPGDRLVQLRAPVPFTSAAVVSSQIENAVGGHSEASAEAHANSAAPSGAAVSDALSSDVASAAASDAAAGPQLKDQIMGSALGSSSGVAPPPDLYFDSTGSKFDYSSGFVRAMSTSAMMTAAEAKAAAAAEEWTILDEDGSSASEEDERDSSAASST